MGSVTIGANNYDIYGTSAGADAYLAARIGSVWADQTATAKAQGLVTGTRLIKTYLASLGFTVDPAGAVDIAIQEANYELAYAVVVDATVADASNANGNKKRVKAGSAEVEYFSPENGGRFPVSVQTLLSGWIAANGGAVSALGLPVASGLGCPPCSDDYGLSAGY